MSCFLVVDDDPIALQLVRVLLSNADHEVVATTDSSEVASLVEANRFDAMVLDVVMPGVSGLELLEQLRSNEATARVPVLLLSARSEGADRVRGLRKGADDYLTKPFEPEELLLRLERLVQASTDPRRSGPTASETESVVQGGSAGTTVDKSGKVFLGRYEVVEEIGFGSMGRIFEGWDAMLQRRVALKTLRFDSEALRFDRAEMAHQLNHEAVIMARLNHPNVVSVYDVGETHDGTFLVLEFVEGVDLEELLFEVEVLPVEQVVPLLIAIGRGLNAAHSCDLVHQDVKPGNVLLDRDGGIKVSDFGIARLMSSLVDGPSGVFGTPGYLPPETVRGRGYTQASDYYSLGVIAYQLLTGVRPCDGPTVKATLERTREGDFVPIETKSPAVPEPVAWVVSGLLTNRPDDRMGIEAIEALETLARRNHWRWRAPTLSKERQRLSDDPRTRSQQITLKA